MKPNCHVSKATYMLCSTCTLSIGLCKFTIINISYWTNWNFTRSTVYSLSNIDHLELILYLFPSCACYCYQYLSLKELKLHQRCFGSVCLLHAYCLFLFQNLGVTSHFLFLCEWCQISCMHCHQKITSRVCSEKLTK